MNLADKNMANQLIKDIRLAKIVNENENYNARLYEAYLRVKELNITSKEEFLARKKESGIGTFYFEEIMYYDRIQDYDYKKLVTTGWDTIHDLTEAIIKAPDIGDRLASYGTLGKTKKL